MRDKNIVMLEGVVGNDLKRGTMSNGKSFITFSLCVNTYFKPLHDSTESEHPMAYIRVFIFDQRMITYLNKCKVRHGQRASVFGRLSSSSKEINGKKIVQVNVVVRDITVSKTKDDYEYTEEELRAMDDGDVPSIPENVEY